MEEYRIKMILGANGNIFYKFVDKDGKELPKEEQPKPGQYRVIVHSVEVIT